MAGLVGTSTSDDGPRRPVFICGCGHSGTTLLLRTLQRVDGLAGPSVESNWALSASLPRRMDALARLEAAVGATCRLVEKTPVHIVHLDRLLEARPVCQILLCMRDVRDVVASRKARGERVDQATRKWLEAARIARRYEQDQRIMVVKYEHLVGSQHEQAAALSSLSTFLGVIVTTDHLVPGTDSGREPFNRIVAPVEKPTVVNTRAGHGALRAWQFNQPLYDGRNRWQTELSRPEVHVIEGAATESLRYFGYQ